jgi:hypothetical protein
MIFILFGALGVAGLCTLLPGRVMHQVVFWPRYNLGMRLGESRAS